MAEAFLQLVVENLGSLIKDEMGLIMGVDDEMKKLSSTLTTIQAVLEDAELKQMQSKSIRDWLRKLTVLAYDIDDILDDCNTHFSKLNISGSNLSRYGLNRIMYRHKIGRRMKHVTERLDSIATERAKFHLREMPLLDRPREVVAAAASRETSSLLKEADAIYGRDEDRDKIVKMLVEDLRERHEMSVLPIIGVGGLGKTTLAQLVYNDPRVVDHFERRIWVCVSDNFEMKALVKAMIESGTRSGKARDLQHLDALERHLWELLSQKRYLIVLDDVWNDQQEKWLELKSILSCGCNGASIIVTTRLKKVADIMGTLPSHCLQGLKDEHCWMLLKQHAFGRGVEEDEELTPKLEVIGKQIVKKCGGVPLAAKALGGILRFKRTEEEWMYVRESEIWKLSPEDSLILPALRLSYHHLPLELRQCFAYFAAFPKDYKIKKEELIHLWMAHGLISAKGTLQVEDVGNEICNELLLRSLLQSTANKHLISMHDLVHDLAESVMENKVPGVQTERNMASASTIRQVNLQHRSVSFPKTFKQDMNISLIMELTSLRVIDASLSGIKHLPASIRNLKHLRSLNLSGCEIRTLPNSLCSLWNLQILNLEHCYMLLGLPKDIRYLRNLRHLYFSYFYWLSEMPSKMRELTQLKTLSTFVVGSNIDNQLEELELLNLGGKLEIWHLERVKGYMDAKKANLGEKKGLRELSLWWRRNKNSSKLEKDNIDEKVLEALEPHPNLESLCINGFKGRYFPRWMCNSTLGSIVRIEIENCMNCKHLPKFGELPHLKRLRIKNVGVEYIIEEEEEVGSGNGVMKQFPALEELYLRYLPNLKGLSKEQESKDAFTNLKVLRIERCASLVLPPLSSFKKMEDLECSSSTLASFSRSPDTLTRLKVMIEGKMPFSPLETLARFSNLKHLTFGGTKEVLLPAQGVEILKNLEHLSIENCETMRCFPEGLLLRLTALKRLSLDSCTELVDLPEEMKHLDNLEMIRLVNLPKMASLPEALRHLSSLTRLYLNRLPELELLPDWLHRLIALRLLLCPNVVSLPAAVPNLKELVVYQCPKLERRCKRRSGKEWHKIAHIPRLRIHN